MTNIYESDNSHPTTADADGLLLKHIEYATDGGDIVLENVPCHCRFLNAQGPFSHRSARRTVMPLAPDMSGTRRNAANVASDPRCSLHPTNDPTRSETLAMALTVHEAIAVQRIAHFLRGGHDLSDQGVRDSLARDLNMLERKSQQRLGAGPVDDAERWSRRLADLADVDGAA